MPPVQTAHDVMVEAGQQLENDIISAIRCFRETTGTAPSAVIVEIERVQIHADRDTFEPVNVRVSVEV